MRKQHGMLSVYNSIPIASIIMLPDAPKYTIVFANATFLHENYAPAEQFSGKGFFEAFAMNADDDPTKKIIDAFQHVLAQNTPHRLKNHRYDLPGDNKENVHYWDIDTYPLLDDNENVEYIVQSSIDVTAKRLAEINLQKNHHKLDKILQSITDGFFVIDKSCSVTYLNNSAKKISGLRADQVIGRCIWDLYPKKLVNDFKVAYIKAEETHAKIRLEQYNEDVNFWYEVTLQPLDEGISVYFRNITYRKEAEEKTKLTLQRNLDLFNFSPVPMWAYNIETLCFVAANQAAQADYGYSLEEYLNLTVNVLWPKSEYSKMEAQLESKVRTRLPNDGIVKHLTKNGKVIDVQIKSQPLPSWGESTRIIMALDITDKLSAKTDLQVAKDRYKNLFDLSPQPMWVYDLVTLMFLDVNDAAIKHYGYSKEEFLSMSVDDISSREDQKTDTGISRHIKKNGETILVSTIGNSIHYGGRNARIVIGIDSTARINAEEALRMSERRFKTLIQDGADLITIANKQGAYKYLSPTSERILQESAETLLGKSAFDNVYGPDREKVKAQFLTISDNQQYQLEPFRMVNAVGEIRWIEAIITNLINDPAIEGIVTNARDVTERLEYQMKITEHLERYNAVSKATSDTIWDANILTGVLTWNHGIEATFGYQTEPWQYERWHEHVHPDDRERVTSVIANNMQNKEPRWTSEYRFLCADGDYKFVLDRGFLIFDDEGIPVRMIGAMQDITERINYIHTIEKSNVLLREIGWTQAHLVRSPLSRILGLTELLKHPGTMNDQQPELLEFLQQSACELDQIVQEIIRKSKQNLK